MYYVCISYDVMYIVYIILACISKNHIIFSIHVHKCMNIIIVCLNAE